MTVIVKERDTEVRPINIYLIVSPIQLTENTKYHGKTEYCHWGLTVQFLGEEEGDIVTRSVELTTLTNKNGRKIITYNYIDSSLGNDWEVRDYGESGKPCPENTNVTFSSRFSPLTLFQIIKNHPMNGMPYKAGAKDCQQYILYILEKLGINLDPEVKNLAEKRVIANFIGLVQDIEAKCTKASNKSKSFYSSIARFFGFSRRQEYEVPADTDARSDLQSVV